MPRATIDPLIVNSPDEEPARHPRYDRTTRLFNLEEGRRPAGYVVASTRRQRVRRSRRVQRDPGSSTGLGSGSRRGERVAIPV